MLLPPYERKGSVIPIIGINPRFIETLITIWKNNVKRKLITR